MVLAGGEKGGGRGEEEGKGSRVTLPMCCECGGLEYVRGRAKGAGKGRGDKTEWRKEEAEGEIKGRRGVQRSRRSERGREEEELSGGRGRSGCPDWSLSAAHILHTRRVNRFKGSGYTTPK